jgi:hypothetical protein
MIAERTPTLAANSLGQSARAIRCGRIGGDGLRAAAHLADLCDEGLRLRLAAAVINGYLGAGLGKGESGGTADATRSSSYPESQVMIWVPSGSCSR